MSDEDASSQSEDSHMVRDYPPGARYACAPSSPEIDGLVYLQLVGSAWDERRRAKNVSRRKSERLKRHDYPVMSIPFDSMWRYEVRIGSNLVIGGVWANYCSNNGRKGFWAVRERDCLKGHIDEKTIVSGISVDEVPEIMLERAVLLRGHIAAASGLPLIERVLRRE